MKNFEKIKQILNRKNISYKLLDAGTTDYSVDAHVKAFGIKYREGLSTLIFKVNGERFIAILRRDDKNIDNKKMKQVLGTGDFAFASPEDLETLGLEVGLASPFILQELHEKHGVTIYADEALFEMDKVVCGSGHAQYGVQATKNDVINTIGEYERVDVTTPNKKRQDEESNVQNLHQEKELSSDNIDEFLNSFEGFKRVYTILKESGETFKVLDAQTDSLDLDEQIRAMDMKYREGLGTLLFRSEKGFIALLRRDDKSVDRKRMKEKLKLKELEYATESDLQKLGFEKGLLSPFLLEGIADIYMDESALEMNRVICGAAAPKCAIELSKDTLLKLIKTYDVIDVTFPNPKRQDADNMQIRRVLSGITPSGSALHIGNYYGAVKPQMDLQNSVEQSYYFAADLHALTTVQDKKVLENNITNNVLDFIALGLDPKKSAYFRQSDVPAHSQLAIVLANYVPLSLMKRMHAFKDKLQKGANEEAINMGLFNYPILMAADILLYKPDGVPVGEDQRQHIELTREVAQKFNNAYNMDFFPLPEPLIQGGDRGKVVGTDGERKMSKSLRNVIGIFDDTEVIRQQIFSCYTDPNRIKATDPGTVEGNPVFIFHDLINDDTAEVDDLKARYQAGNVGDVEVKEKLFKAHQRVFAEAKEKRKAIEGNRDLAKDILREGAKKADLFAKQTLEEVYDIIGMKNDLSILFN